MPRILAPSGGKCSWAVRGIQGSNSGTWRIGQRASIHHCCSSEGTEYENSGQLDEELDDDVLEEVVEEAVEESRVSGTCVNGNDMEATDLAVDNM